MAPREGRLPELDLLRAVGILAVVWIHASGEVVPSSSPPLGTALNASVTLCRFAVPAFIVASGLVLQMRYGTREGGAGQFLRRRWTRVLVPWPLWAGIYLLLMVAIGRLPADAGAVAGWLGMGPVHLYFLLVIAQLYLVFLLLPSGPRGLALAAAGLLAVQLACEAWRTFGPLPGGPLAFPLAAAAFTEWPYWAGYFALGCLLGAVYPRLRETHRAWPVALGAAALGGALVLWFGMAAVPGDPAHQSTYAYLWPAAVPFAVAALLALLWGGVALWPRLPGRLQAATSWLGANSLGVYLVHLAPLLLLAVATRGEPGWVRLPVMTAGSLAAAVLITRFLKRTPLAFATGDAQPSRPAARRAPRVALG